MSTIFFPAESLRVWGLIEPVLRQELQTAGCSQPCAEAVVAGVKKRFRDQTKPASLPACFDLDASNLPIAKEVAGKIADEAVEAMMRNLPELISTEIREYAAKNGAL